MKILMISGRKESQKRKEKLATFTKTNKSKAADHQTAHKKAIQRDRLKNENIC